MQRLALFDLGNTLIDPDQASRRWVAEFAEKCDLGDETVEWLIELDRSVHPYCEVFFTRVREYFGPPDSVDALWSQHRKRMSHLVYCRPEALYGLTHPTMSAQSSSNFSA
ncbi:hypothetical protein ACFQVD_34350 [Streptosporangium amethystogenes subsp. fukuiense]|uniref:Uncharacterized protein n=1 Tax=Streptosporangium amethystogenes subsp. fukuiense TaxID=698418 RepID=A0ABW2T926_9ACTN